MFRRLTLIAAALLWMAFLANHYWEISASAISRPVTTDFYKFYLSAHRWHAGHSMYWMVPPRLKKGDPCHPDTPPSPNQFAFSKSQPLNLGGEYPCLNPNLNPPVFMTVMHPLSMLQFGSAWRIWSALSAISIALSAWMLAGTWTKGKSRATWTLVTSAVLFTFYPVIANFTLGQLAAFLLPLLIGSWKEAHSEDQTTSGLLLGLLISIKPFFAVLLLGLFVARMWRTLAYSCVAIASLSVLGLVLFGLDSYSDYLQIAANVNWTASNWNGSWLGFFDRIFSGQAQSNWPATKGLSQSLATSFCVVTLGLYLMVVRHLSLAPKKQRDAVYAIGIPSALLISPLGWSYYFMCLLPSLAIIWRHAQTHVHRRQIKWALILIWVMLMTPVGLKPVPTPHNPTNPWGIDSWYCYILSLTLIASTWALIRNKKGRRSAPFMKFPA